MDDTISRQKAIATVHRMREIWDTGDVDDLEDMIATALAELCPAQPDLEELDFVQPHPKTSVTLEILSQPQRTGRWIPCTKNGLSLSEMAYREGQKWYGYKCSNCNSIYKGNALTESPYCKKCGARMEGENDSD